MTFRISHSLQLRFILPVSALVIVLVLGGAFAFSFSEGKRIETEITRHTEEQAHGVTDLLGLTDALIMQQVQGAMKVLIERGGTFGTAALGPSVRVKDKTVPDLLFGSKPQANQFDLVDGVTQAVGGTATLFVKSGDEFVRISTNVKRDGERAIGTVLDPKGKVIAAIRAGQVIERGGCQVHTHRRLYAHVLKLRAQQRHARLHLHRRVIRSTQLVLDEGEGIRPGQRAAVDAAGDVVH